MKKFKIFVLILMFLFIAGCSTNKSMVVTNLEDFSRVALNNNFSVIDTSYEYEDVGYITGVREAKLDGVKIEMWTYNDIESAEKVHSEHIDNFNLLKTTGAYEIDEEGKNYYKYVLVSNGYFMISTRVENTIIFCKTALDNKDTVEKIFNDIGY